MLRCLHPPGGAAALTTALLALNGQIPGPLFVLIPVGLNALLMVLLAWLFHHLSHHAYPHVPAPAPEPEKARLFTDADLDAVLADEHEAFDIERADLERLIARVEEAARRRRASGRPAGKR
jgi:CBS domain-containing membrane protein